MAIFESMKKGLVQIGNRDDRCCLCEKEITAKTDEEKRAKLKELSGKLEGKRILKLNRNGVEIVICLDHIHQIAKANPLQDEE